MLTSASQPRSRVVVGTGVDGFPAGYLGIVTPLDAPTSARRL
jgi:hypothetical protein